MLDPGLVFDDPAEVIDITNVDESRKIEILRRWEYDAREIDVAREEAMMSDLDSDLFDRVLRALHRLGGHPELDRTHLRNNAAFDCVTHASQRSSCIRHFLSPGSHQSDRD